MHGFSAFGKPWRQAAFSLPPRPWHDVWMGDQSYRAAIDSGDLLIEGDPILTRRMSTWMRPSVFYESQRAPVPERLRAAA